MAITYSNINFGSSTSNAASYTLNGFVPAVGDLLVVTVVAGATVATPGLTDDQSGTYYLAATQSIGGDLHCIFVREQLVASAVSHQQTFTCTGDNADGIDYDQLAFSGSNRAGAAAVRQSATPGSGASSTTPGCVFPNAALSANAIVTSCGNSSNPAALAGPASFTERQDSGYNTPTTGHQTCTRDSGFSGTTLTWSGTSATAWGALAIELEAGPAAVFQEEFPNPARGSVGQVPLIQNAAPPVNVAALAICSLLGATEAANVPYLEPPPIVDEGEATLARHAVPDHMPAVLALFAVMAGDEEIERLDVDAADEWRGASPWPDDHHAPTCPVDNDPPITPAADLPFMADEWSAPTLTRDDHEWWRPWRDSDQRACIFQLGPQDYAARYDAGHPNGRTLSGSDITTLKDLSGNDYDLTEATAPPDLVADSDLGRDVADLDGAEWWNDSGPAITSVMSNQAGSFTAIVKIKPTATPDRNETANPDSINAVLSCGEAAVGVRQHTTLGLQMGVASWASGYGSGQYCFATGGAVDRWSLLTVTFDGSTFTAQIDRGNVTTLGSLTHNTWSGSLAIGFASGGDFTGRVAEIRTWTRVLSAAERDAVFDELMCTPVVHEEMRAALPATHETEHNAAALFARGLGATDDAVEQAVVAALDDGGGLAALVTWPHERAHALVRDDDLPAGSLTGTPDADEVRGPLPPPTVAAHGALYLTDAEEIPAGTLTGTPDADEVRGPLPAPVDAVHGAPYLPDAEEIPAGSLSGTPDSDDLRGPRPTPTVAAHGAVYLPDAEEIPAGSLVGTPDSNDLAGPRPAPTVPEHVVALPASDEAIAYAEAPLLVEENEAGPRPTPTGATHGAVYLPDPEEHPAGELFGVPDDGRAADVTWPAPAVAIHVVILPTRDETVAYTAPPLNVEENEAGPLPAPVGATHGTLYLPDPEELPAATLVGVHEEDAPPRLLVQTEHVPRVAASSDDEAVEQPYAPDDGGAWPRVVHTEAAPATALADDGVAFWIAIEEDARAAVPVLWPVEQSRPVPIDDEQAPPQLVNDEDPRVPLPIVWPERVSRALYHHEGDNGWESIYEVERLLVLAARAGDVTLKARSRSLALLARSRVVVLPEDDGA